MRNFHVKELPEIGGTVDLPEAEARHALRVLRLAVGDRIALFNGLGEVASAEIVEARIGRRACGLRVRVFDRSRAQPVRPQVHLYVAPPKGRRMDFLVQATAALGVASVHPIKCRYAVAEPASRACLEQWSRQAVEALKQSGYRFLPQFHAPVAFAEALAGSPPGFFGDLGLSAQARGLTAAQIPEECALWIGPEGGFCQGERDELRAGGLRGLTVGKSILRVELAAAVALGVLIGAKVE